MVYRSEGRGLSLVSAVLLFPWTGHFIERFVALPRCIHRYTGDHFAGGVTLRWTTILSMTIFLVALCYRNRVLESTRITVPLGS